MDSKQQFDKHFKSERISICDCDFDGDLHSNCDIYGLSDRDGLRDVDCKQKLDEHCECERIIIYDCDGD